MWKQWKARVRELRQNIYALYLASLDPRVPWLAKVIIGVIVAYALSPIDLVPDFIPILGYLDDLLLVPLGILLAIKMIPYEVWQDCQARSRAASLSNLPHSRLAGAVIVILWITGLTWLAWFGWRFFDGG